MHVLTTTIADTRRGVAAARSAGKAIGFVPTMGALHEGHAAPVRRARTENGFVVVSVFVNPMQFGPNEDFSRYPRTLPDDRTLCEREGADLVFAPEAAEIYPSGSRTAVEVAELDEHLCGASRPGHFRGVATVVLKLLNIVQPDRAYFGQKDAQQARIVQQMVRDLDVPTAIVVAPTVREEDGLAMSSRNRYLDPAERKRATVLIQALREVRQRAAAGERDARSLRQTLIERIAATTDAALDYAEIVDADSLRPIDRLAGPALAALAVRFGATRLIDNIELPPADSALETISRAGQRRKPSTPTTRAIMSHPLFGPEIRLMLHEGDATEMRTFCETLHPATVAEALTDETLKDDDIWRVLQTTSIPNQAAIFEYFPIDVQVRLIEGTGRPHVARLIEKMSHDDRVLLVRKLPPRIADAILRLVDEADRRDIASLVQYPANSVGALMTTDYAWLPVTARAGEAVTRLRQLAPNSETIYYIYVLEEPSRRLAGVVSLRELILAPPQQAIRDLMDSDLQTLHATDSREKAAQELARYDFLAMPVVDDAGRLVGIVTHDDVIDVVVEQATEDVHRLGGLGPLAENYLEANFFTIWRTRAFWLACLFGAELFTFTALSQFEDEINKLVVLSLFVPLCISTGGNSGSQAATLITRAMALGQLTLRSWTRVLRHEVFMGVALGAALAVIAFIRGAATPESVRGGSRELDEPVSFRLPTSVGVESASASGVVKLPAQQLEMIMPKGRDIEITLPADAAMEVIEAGKFKEYRFPAKSEVREPPVDRWKLAKVIALSVAGICLWGTIVGSMLPFAFKAIGADPGVASSPFVATFVDVTGILIYFSIAKVYLL